MTYAIAGRAGAAPHNSRRAAGHSFIETIRHRHAVRRTIRELDRLTDRQLADIGLTTRYCARFDVIPTARIVMSSL